MTTPIPFASHHVSPQTPVPAVDVLIGGVWAGTLLANFPTAVTVCTGMLAGIYYAIIIWDKIKEKLRKP